MAELVERQSALAAVYQVGATGGAMREAPGVIITERRPLSVVHIAGQANDKALQRGVKKATGCALPTVPNTVAWSGQDAVAWLAPTRWLAISPDQGPGVLQNALRSACGDDVAIADVSHGRTVLRLSGPDARTVLMKGAPLDFHPSVFVPGSCAQSTISQCGVLLVCVRDDAFDILSFRAFGRHMFEWALDASREFGYRVDEVSAS